LTKFNKKSIKSAKLFKQKKSNKTKPKENDFIINLPNSKRLSKIHQTKLLTLKKKCSKFKRIRRKGYKRRSKRRNKSYFKPKRRKDIKKGALSAVPESIYSATVPQTKAVDFVTNAAHRTITIATVKSKHISWQTVFTAVRRAT
jgi:hypothetical protein